MYRDALAEGLERVLAISMGELAEYGRRAANRSTAITIRPAMSTNTSDFSANSSIVIRPGRGDRAVPPRRVGEVVAEGIGGRPSRTRGTMMHG